MVQISREGVKIIFSADLLQNFRIFYLLSKFEGACGTVLFET